MIRICPRFPHFLHLFMLLTLVSASARAAGPAHPAVSPGELIVAYRPGVIQPAAGRQPALQSLSPTPKEPMAPLAADAFAARCQPVSLRQLHTRYGLREGFSLASSHPATAPTVMKLQNQPAAPAPAPAAAPATASELWLLRFDPAADVNELASAYQADPNVLFVEPNYIGSLCYIPSDPFYLLFSSDLDLIGLPAAWDVQQGASPSVVVAVIDSGIDAAHPELAAAVDLANSYNFVDHNASVFDAVGHGTRVAGLIGAAANNGLGSAGVAFGCRLLSLNVSGANGNLTVADVVAAINWAVVHGAQVINMSLEFNARSQSLESACNAAAAAGAVLVASAGNENQGDEPAYPAAFDSVLGVGAVDDGGAARAPWSNYNGICRNLVDLVAPGTTLFSTIPGGQYNGLYTSGTSFAAALVSGTAALLKARWPEQSGPALRQHLLATALDLGASFVPAGGAGAGLLRAGQALGTPMRPDLSVESVTVDDSPFYSDANNGDGTLDRGETVRLRVRLKNGAADLRSASATLSTTDTLVTIGDNVANWGAIACGQSQDPSNTFTNVILAVTAEAHQISFVMNVTSQYATGQPDAQQTLRFNVAVENTRTVNAANYFSAQTWTAGNTYEVLGTQNFNAGLTIEPGTTVKVAPGVDLNINGGEFIASGADQAPIRFTALNQKVTSASQTVAGPLADLGPHTVPVNTSGYNAVYYVSQTTGSDSTGDGSRQRPWATLGQALSRVTGASAASKMALLVARGTYSGKSNQSSNPMFAMKDYIDLYGGFNPADWSREISINPTILDGQKTNPVIQGANASRLDGFSIVNGYQPYGNCGLYISNGTMTCTNNVFKNNDGFGAITLAESSTDISNNLFINNKTDAITCSMNNSNLSPKISQNIFSCSDAGSIHIFPYGKSTCTVTNNIITRGNLVIAAGAPTNVANILSNYFLGCGISTGSSLFAKNNCIIGYSSYAISVDHTSVYLHDNVISDNNTAIGGSGLTHFSLVNNTMIGNNYFSNNAAPQVILNNILYPQTSVPSPGSNEGKDPKIVGPLAFGQITQITFDPDTFRSTLLAPAVSLAPDSLVGRVINVEKSAYMVVSNTGHEITVLGNAGVTSRPPYPWKVVDYHLRPDSPCIDAGVNDGSLATDFEGDPRMLKGRTSLTIDMGADEYNPANPAAQGTTWGKLTIKGSVSNVVLAHCTVEHGQGVLNQCASASVMMCDFNHNYGIGFESTAKTSDLILCKTALNYLDGIKAPLSNLTACTADANGGTGLTGAVLNNCTANNNLGSGLVGASASDCTAQANRGDGLTVTGAALRCMAEANGGKGIIGNASKSAANSNGGLGISGSASNCTVYGNGGGGVAGTATNSQIIRNTGIGVSGSSTLSGCEIRENSGAAVSGAQTISACKITANGTGVSGAKTINTSAITANGGSGINGGAVTGCAVLGNGGLGITTTGAVGNCWVAFNQGAGVSGAAGVGQSWVAYNGGIGLDAPAGNVDNSAIIGNGGIGVRNLAAPYHLSHCDLYDNKDYDLFTDRNNAATGYPDNVIDARFNYWGQESMAEMTQAPFPSDTHNIARIYDLFDSALTNGWYVNYGGAGEFLSAPLATTPDSNAPAILLRIEPSVLEPANVGLTTFTLTFSKPMKRSVHPSVTFDRTAPYTAHVVEASRGWASDTVWQGVFAISSSTGDGLNTVRVAGATDVNGYVIPNDTLHQFTIDTSGHLGANNGLAIIQGTKVRLEWAEAGKPLNARGYNVLRSASGLPGSYQPIITEPITGPVYTDDGLEPRTTYYYIIYIVDGLNNASQWTAPIVARTGDANSATKDWLLYR